MRARATATCWTSRATLLHDTPSGDSKLYEGEVSPHFRHLADVYVLRGTVGQLTFSWAYSYGFLWMMLAPEPISGLRDVGLAPCWAALLWGRLVVWLSSRALPVL